MEVLHVCPVCGAKIEMNKYGGYRTYCSKSCATKAQRANPENERKLKETCLRKYGVDNPAKAKSIIRKAQQTCITKYGGTSPMNNKDVIKKFNESKFNNNTFNKSKQEEDSFTLLYNKYPDVIRQYTSEIYPFNCDFYIPSLDLYIECNYHWTHGGHPYNKEIDIDKLNNWQEKAKISKFYINAINTWTIRDVNKRQLALQNKLNYLEFYTLQELQKWLEQN